MQVVTSSAGEPAASPNAHKSSRKQKAAVKKLAQIYIALFIYICILPNWLRWKVSQMESSLVSIHWITFADYVFFNE